MARNGVSLHLYVPDFDAREIDKAKKENKWTLGRNVTSRQVLLEKLK